MLTTIGGYVTISQNQSLQSIGGFGALQTSQARLDSARVVLAGRRSAPLAETAALVEKSGVDAVIIGNAA